MDGEAIFFTGRGGQEGACPKIYGAGAPPFPTVRGGAGKGAKSAGRGTYCVYQLIDIICCSKGNQAKEIRIAFK